MWRWGILAVVGCGGDADGEGNAAACLGGGDWTFEYTRAAGSSPACPELGADEGPAIASEDFAETCDAACTCSDEYAGCDYTLSEVCDRNGQSTTFDCSLALDPDAITGTCTMTVSVPAADVTCQYAVDGHSS